jgi:alpha-glucan phosphorylase-like protein
MAHYPERLKISWQEFYQLGNSGKAGKGEKFNMSFLAAHLSQEVNGVSKLHGKVSRELFSELWPGYLPEELHIGHVTNGVHFPTWAATEWKNYFNSGFENNWSSNIENKRIWTRINEIENVSLWNIKKSLKKKLIDNVKERLHENLIKRHERPKNILEIREKLNSEILTIGFARRFATYKRAHLLFKDLNRLNEIVNNSDKPVQFLFAGKAHPHDGGGQDLIRKIIEISKMPEFRGKILFLQNYDMELAKLLVQGVDVWLNTPTRPLEASGTSGEKAVMNGTLHFSVLDGWWVEGYKPEAGWALTGKRTYDNQEFQDELDAEIIINILESEIIPLYYDRNNDGIPENWISYMKKSFSQIAPDFTMSRMLKDYFNKYYLKLAERSKSLTHNHYFKTKSLVLWKKQMVKAWEDLEVLSLDLSGLNGKVYQIGKEYKGNVILDLKGLPQNSIGLELVVTDTDKNGKIILIHSQEFNLEKFEGSKAYYEIRIIPTLTGVFNYGLRIFPRHDDLPHRQDFNLVKWA